MAGKEMEGDGEIERSGAQKITQTPPPLFVV
jgi:hypothetical protein